MGNRFAVLLVLALVLSGCDLLRPANANGSPDTQLGLPSAGTWQEVLNTDAEGYAGSGVGNLGGITAVEGEHLGQPAYADIVVPPLATVWFRARSD